MKIFIEAIDVDIWDTVLNGPFMPKHVVNEEEKDKPRSLWTDDDKKAKNIITTGVSIDEFFRISTCNSGKEMWYTLEVAHEGTIEVRRSRMNTLTHEYELFRMLHGESISDMKKRFTYIVNQLSALVICLIMRILLTKF